MALIDYLNRVHFADSILEEALWAELELRQKNKFLILTTNADIERELGERLKSGVPAQISTVHCPMRHDVPTESEALRIARICRQKDCTGIIACGPGQVIDLAKVVRLLIAHDVPLSRFSETEGGATYISRALPDVIAIPRLQGFVAGFNGLVSVVLNGGKTIDIASRRIVPTVTICDPTIAMKEPSSVQASHCVEALTLSIEALLSPSFNPPANGMAMDGLKRSLQALGSISDYATLNERREQMAAGISAALVQQKGLGLAHAVTNALCSVADGMLDKGAIKRLLLPPIIAFYAEQNVLSRSALIGAMGHTNPSEGVKTLRRALQDLPLPASLRAMGITKANIEQSCQQVTRHRALSNTPCNPKAGDIKRILTSVF